MKLLRHLCLLLILCALPFARAETVNHALWKIEKADTPTSYLVGTVHFGRHGDTLNPVLRQILAQSDALMTESVIPVSREEAMQPEIIAQFQSIMSLGDRGALRHQLGAAGYQQTQKYFDDTPALSPFAPVLDDLQPWAVLMYILSAPPQGYDSTTGIDYLLSRHAQAQGIRRLGLEESAQTFAVFKNLPADKIISALEVNLTHQAENAADKRRLVRLYQQGKIAALLRWARDEKQALKHLPPADKPFWKQWLYHTILDERTARWIAPALAQLRREKTMIAVGMMHLDGENGMIAKLRAAGYRVTAVP